MSKYYYNAIESVETIIIDHFERSNFNMYHVNIDDKLITKWTTMCRSLMEIKRYIKREKENMKSSAFFGGYGVPMGLPLELHHHPLRMKHLVIIAVEELKSECKDGIKIYTKDVLNKVIEYHLSYQVGLIPLDPTSHELNHSNELYIHPKLVKNYNGYKEFIEEKKRFLTEEIKTYISIVEEEAKIRKPETYPEILKRKRIIFDVKDYVRLDMTKIDELIMKDARDRLEAIL